MRKILAVGTRVATVGTFYMGEVVSSELTERGAYKHTIRWTESVPLAKVYKGEETVCVVTPRTRMPLFVVCAQD